MAAKWESVCVCVKTMIYENTHLLVLLTTTRMCSEMMVEKKKKE